MQKAAQWFFPWSKPPPRMGWTHTTIWLASYPLPLKWIWLNQIISSFSCPGTLQLPAEHNNQPAARVSPNSGLFCGGGDLALTNFRLFSFCIEVLFGGNILSVLISGKKRLYIEAICGIIVKNSRMRIDILNWNAIICLAMLYTLWQSNRQDLLDLYVRLFCILRCKIWKSTLRLSKNSSGNGLYVL